MKKIIAVWPREPRTKDSKTIALFYAMILVVFTAAQLFSLEKFIPLLETFNLPGNHAGRFVAVTLVVCGVFALPFLLRMKLSVGMRWFSMFAGWVVPAVWLFVSLWVNVFQVSITNAGYLGASVQLLPGWWTVAIAAALGVLAAWSTWGLWPGSRFTLLESKRKK
ncbi:MAG TPA: hypothetical protein PKD28_00400 [Candidatus Saccharibacteria bacterium]|nr:hypothetical protein [Candidatus Saccharibacteria bacterium]